MKTLLSSSDGKPSPNALHDSISLVSTSSVSQPMYRITRTSTMCITITAATVALILLTSATLTTSVYAARHHHGNRSIEDDYQTYGLSGPPLSAVLCAASAVADIADT